MTQGEAREGQATVKVNAASGERCTPYTATCCRHLTQYGDGDQNIYLNQSGSRCLAAFLGANKHDASML